MHGWSSRARRAAAVVPGVVRWLLLVAGTALALDMALRAFGGYQTLSLYERRPHHRFTAMALLTGTLRLRATLGRLEWDEQVFNGAVYTNWGYGVPLLQAPFHALARRLHRFPAPFFPDRGIYMSYVAAAIPALWAGFDRMFAARDPGTGTAARLRRHAVSWSATVVALATALFPLMASRFMIYEETICYLVILELLALSAYLCAGDAWRALPTCALGLAAGMGLLVRPTGAIYLATWALLVLLGDGTRRRRIGIFAAACGPFVAFWLYSNWVRSGSVFSVGYANAMPYQDYHTAVVRFGSLCADTPAHALHVAGRLLRTFFLGIAEDADPWMARCHFEIEERSTTAPTHEPFFGIGVLVVLVWILANHVFKRERDLSAYVPFLGLALLFASYVSAGAGFAWRYSGDFWPFVVAACALYLRRLPRSASTALGWPLAVAGALGAAVLNARQWPIARDLAQTELVDAYEIPIMWDTFSNARWGTEPPRPSRIRCTDLVDGPFHNKLGWLDGCELDTATNVFLGVPWTSDDRHELRFETAGETPSSVRVYVNGRYYTAHREGNLYRATLDLRQAGLVSPTVLTTVQWTPGPDAVPGRLLWIEIV